MLYSSNMAFGNDAHINNYHGLSDDFFSLSININLTTQFLEGWMSWPRGSAESGRKYTAMD